MTGAAVLSPLKGKHKGGSRPYVPGGGPGSGVSSDSAVCPPLTPPDGEGWLTGAAVLSPLRGETQRGVETVRSRRRSGFRRELGFDRMPPSNSPRRGEDG